MVYLLYWLITPRKAPRVRVNDGDQETWSRLSHQNHSPSLLPWFVTPSGALSSQMPSCGIDTVVRTAAVGYHQPPAGIAVLTLKVVRAPVCQTRRAAGFRAVHEAAPFRIVASAGSISSPKLSTPYPVIPRYRPRKGASAAGQWKMPGNTMEKRWLHRLAGACELWPPGPRPEPGAIT